MSPRPCWILCTPRSGSSYLCDLLNNTGLFPAFSDPRLADKVGPLQRGLAFNEWLRIFDSPRDIAENTPVCCKAIYHQYVEAMGSIRKEARRKPSSNGYAPIDPERNEWVRDKYPLTYVKACLPGVRFIKLKRDPISQAVSTYFARKTEKYHLYDVSDAERYFSRKIPLSYELLDVYKEVVDLTDAWDGLCRWQTTIDIDYDSLVGRPEDTLSAILEFLEADKSEAKGAVEKTQEASRLIRMTRPESPSFERFLRTHIQPIL